MSENTNHIGQLVGTIIFFCAILHTFLTSKINKIAHKKDKSSTSYRVLHLLGEVEVVFGFWAVVLYLSLAIIWPVDHIVQYHDSIDFKEPLFVFCIMLMSASRPVVWFAEQIIIGAGRFLNKYFKVPRDLADLSMILILGPLAGSVITEPAAMTISAMLLLIVLSQPSKTILYFTLATLFVNISVGGSLTHFAAPPILMVANKWSWGTPEIFNLFGFKALVAVVANTVLFIFIFYKQLKPQILTLDYAVKKSDHGLSKMNYNIAYLHLILLVLLVLSAHHTHLFMGILCLFFGLVYITQNYHEKLRLKESFLVAFFLAGIMVFGGFQRWWLEPILTQLSSFALYLGATVLTSFTDNAALTYLGSQVEGLTEPSKVALVAGALVGGGLTIIANAPNAAGYSVLSSKFESDGGLNHGRLFVSALVPTIISFLCFWFL